MAERQTATYLNERFAAAGLRPLTRFGQNFLIDLNLLDLIVRAAEIGSQDVVLEVGTGMGSLTTRIAEQAAAVVTVEIDDNLAELSREELARYTNIQQLHVDVLKNKHTLAPEVLQSVGQVLATTGAEARFMLVANLPYNIATPLVSNLLVGPLPPDRMVVTIQKELADRITASPGSKDYGALSVWVQSQCAAQIVRVMPPQVFWPRPKVESAILRIDLQPERRAAIDDLKFFHETVRALFFHRRKFLRSVACSAFKGRLSKTIVDVILAQAGYTGDERAEQLTIDQFLELTRNFRAALQKRDQLNG